MSKVVNDIIVKFNKESLKQIALKSPEDYQCTFSLFKNEKTFNDEFVKFETNGNPQVVKGVKRKFSEAYHAMGREILSNEHTQQIGAWLEHLSNIVLSYANKTK